MDSENIKQLLQKYWDGETTLQEESELREYFNSDTIDPSLKKEAVVFKYFSEQAQLKPKKEPELSFEPKEEKKGRVISLWNLAKAAAVITVIATASWLVSDEIKSDPESRDVIVDTFEDPKEAFEETKKALMMISQNIGKGKTHASKIKAFSEAEEKVKKGVSKKEKEENI